MRGRGAGGGGGGGPSSSDLCPWLCLQLLAGPSPRPGVLDFPGTRAPAPPGSDHRPTLVHARRGLPVLSPAPKVNIRAWGFCSRGGSSWWEHPGKGAPAWRTRAAGHGPSGNLPKLRGTPSHAKPRTVSCSESRGELRAAGGRAPGAGTRGPGVREWLTVRSMSIRSGVGCQRPGPLLPAAWRPRARSWVAGCSVPPASALAWQLVSRARA